MPLDATFDNCIIDGSYSEGDQPLKGELSVNNPENGRLSFLFNHCAVKTMAVEDSAFTHVQFIHKENPVRYKYTGSAQDNLFDFRPDTCRALTGQADPDIAARYPLDRFGIDRTSGKDGPDIGAYEYTPDPPAEEEKKLTGQQPA